VNLSRRERTIAIIALGALVLLVLDHYVLTPVLDDRERVRMEAQTLMQDTEQALNLFERSKTAARRWREMTQAGMKEDAAEAESQMLHAVRDWAERTGLSLASVRPERVAGGEDLKQITFRAAGTGPMRSVARFLWEMHSSQVPLRIHDLQLGSRTEGRDDLSLQLRFSTLYAPPAGEAARPSRVAAAGAGGPGT